jgi:membrane-bound lytic murein transglycosylase B
VAPREFLTARSTAIIRGVVVTALVALLPMSAAAVTAEEYPELDPLIDTLVTQHNFERASVRKLFAGATLRPEIITAIDRPREALPWHEYRRSFLNEERVRLGARYWWQHKDVLARAERQYGVPPELIVAIIGIETRYGTSRGEYSALDALLTLTLMYPRRADFFRLELIEFLLLTRELDLDPRTVKGSYAGALGIPQFMPRSYREYAVDFDNDRRRDLLENSSDAIGSVANFLRRHGWATGEPVIVAADAKGTLYSWPLQLGTEPVLRVREWVGHGIFPRREPLPGENAGDDERPAALIMLDGESGPLYYLGYNNFYVITRYNRSKNYAMVVYELAQMIRLRYQEGT